MDKFIELYKKLFLSNIEKTPRIKESEESFSILESNHFLNEHICRKGTQVTITKEE